MYVCLSVKFILCEVELRFGSGFGLRFGLRFGFGLGLFVCVDFISDEKM